MRLRFDLSSRPTRLAACHGYDVAATDGVIGEVETPLFPPDVAEPDFLVVRVRNGVRRRLPVVSATLVEDIDDRRGIVYVNATREEIARLPERLPLAV